MLPSILPAPRPLLAALALALLTACAAPEGTVTRDAPHDPNERWNRQAHAFNRGLDRAVIRPAAMGYSAAMPDDIEAAVGRFAFNLSIPGAVVNNVLQGNMRAAIEDGARFVVNSTVGLGGVFDPATELSMPAATDADFGQTLHVWGVPAGPYMELPLLGPGTRRHIAGRVVDIFLDPVGHALSDDERYYRLGVRVASGLGNRARYSDSIDSVLYESADSYAATRSLYLQNRQFKLDRGRGDSYQDPYDEINGAPTEESSDAPVSE